MLAASFEHFAESKSSSIFPWDSSACVYHYHVLQQTTGVLRSVLIHAQDDDERQ